jgi:FkbM family methyltransferase
MRHYVNKVRRAIRVIQGQDFYASPDVQLESVRLGSDYGGWHVATRGLHASSIIYSAGLGEDASFDLAIAELLKSDVHVFDPTPRSMAWARAQNFPSSIKLHDIGIANYDGTASFIPPENPLNISHSMTGRPQGGKTLLELGVKRLSTLMRELGHDHIDVFKMDIEGAEYDVISDIGNSGPRPTQILVEFHHRFPGIGVEKSKDAVSQLKKIGYKLFNVSESGEEYSFVLQP